MKNNTPVVVISRTSTVFLERLFDPKYLKFSMGLLRLKNIVRVPGERAKVAVESYDDRIEPCWSLRWNERFQNSWHCKGIEE